MNNTDGIHARMQQRLKKRYRAEMCFRLAGIVSLSIGFIFLLVLLGSISISGVRGLQASYVQLDIVFDADILSISDPGSEEQRSSANYDALLREALRRQFPDVQSRGERRALSALISSGAAYTLRDRMMDAPALLGQSRSLWLLLDDEAHLFLRNARDTANMMEQPRLTEQQIVWLDALAQQGRLKTSFNWGFFSGGDSREPEVAGIGGAIAGSFFVLIATLLMSFPIGVATAIYLEEFAPRNRWTDLIEININNLASVPSIVFGLLGLAVFINFMSLPRSAPLVGGLVLTLMTLPTIIIASRAAIKSVPPSIREAALGIGASQMQTVLHHVLPLAMPGMLTGAIIGMARALGETAPLLMIGMVAFIVDVPGGFSDPATVLPVQVFVWADSPERLFVEKTSAAILVLLLFLMLMNGLAVIMRKKFERRW